MSLDEQLSTALEIVDDLRRVLLNARTANRFPGKAEACETSIRDAEVHARSLLDLLGALEVPS